MAGFNKEELYEIEKAFDQIAFNNLQCGADLHQKLWPAERGGNRSLADRFFKEMENNFSMFRTISAKASLMREDLIKEEAEK